jgi:hypothetical protein
MLELGDHDLKLAEVAGPLKCEVNLPAWWEDSSDKTGLLPGKYVDRRRHPRYHFRVSAALQYRQTFPALPRPDVRHRVFTKDLSRSGLSFLHSESLFPRERMQLFLPQHGARTIEVVWCTRIQERCFHVGARFVERSGGLRGENGDRDNDPAAPESCLPSEAKK